MGENFNLLIRPRVSIILLVSVLHLQEQIPAQDSKILACGVMIAVHDI
jgi:hypothetical protein